MDEPTEPAEVAALRQALHEVQCRLQAVVEVSGEPMGTIEFALREDGELILVRGDAFAQAYSYESFADILGKPLREALPGLAGTDLPRLLSEVARSGRPMLPRSYVPPVSRRDHAYTGFAFQSAPGRVVIKFWPSFGPDEAREILQSNQLLLSQIFGNSPVAVALTREGDGTIVDVNNEWSRLTGYARHEALGRTTAALGFWSDEQNRAQALQPLLDNDTVRLPESPMHTRDGRHVVTAMHGSRLVLGGVRHLLIYLVDMTARHEAEAALRQLNAELESRVEQRTAELARSRNDAETASRYKSEFLSGMSHELRTPLNAILGFGQLLQSDPGLALLPRQLGYVGEILRAGSHLLELINEVLDLARIEAGKLQISLEPVHVGALIDDCLALLRPAAQARRVALAVSPPAAADVHVRADRTRAKQVLLNLLSNAIKYNHEGGSVRLACVVDGESLRIDVQDTGPGLTAAQQARLFQDFERLDADQSTTQGSGIGLALSRRLVHLMHGEIGVHSEVGAGSRFWVRLQRTPGPQPAIGATMGIAVAPPGQVPVADAAPARAHCVLYIEDNPTNVLLMEAALRLRRDVRMLHAALPEQGLALAQAELPDLILLDIQLPGIDGFEVLRRLRLNEATRGIPAVAVSANAMAPDVARGLASGFAHYLTKPLDVVRLLAVVDQLLPR